MRLGEALQQSRVRTAYSRTADARIIAKGPVGEMSTLFVYDAITFGMKPLVSFGKKIIDTVYAIKDWEPVNPKSPLTLLAECADEDAE